MTRKRRRKCRCCPKLFDPEPRVGDKQKTCGSGACQRALKTAQQRKRRQQDPDYRENDARANREWRANNKDYWPRRRKKESLMRTQKAQHQQSRTGRDCRTTTQEEESVPIQGEGRAVLQLRTRAKNKRSIVKNGETFEIEIVDGQLINLQILAIANEAAINVQRTRVKGVNSS